MKSFLGMVSLVTQIWPRVGIRLAARSGLRWLSRLGALVLVFYAVVPCRAVIRIYYLRHGETGYNVKRQWESVPVKDWPAYVGHDTAFSPRGEQQVAAVPAKLAPYGFDCIAVSPLLRTRQTILPYLQAHHRTAELWPELIEIDLHQSHLVGRVGLPPPAQDLFDGGNPLVVENADRSWFSLRPDGTRAVKLGRTGPEGAADVAALARAVIARIKARFGGTDASILLVGHGTAGKLLLRLLLDRPAWDPDPIVNTGLWMAEEQPDGTFALRIYNDCPINSAAPPHPAP